LTQRGQGKGGRALDAGCTNIKSKTGETKGWLKQHTLDEDRINVYDKNGDLKGVLRKDTLNPDNWQFGKKLKLGPGLLF
jgi:hypothetical protein